jgi:hypothetical protein
MDGHDVDWLQIGLLQIGVVVAAVCLFVCSFCLNERTVGTKT